MPGWVESEDVTVLGELPDEPALREHEAEGLSMAGEAGSSTLRPAAEAIAQRIDE